MSEYFILSPSFFLYIASTLLHFDTLSVTIGNKFKAKDDKFDDLLDGVDLKDLFD